MNGDDSSTAGGQVAPEPSGRRQARRWVKVCIAAVVVLASLVGIVYLRAFLTLDSSTFSRALVWVDADVDDFRRFPARRIHAPPDPYLYEKGPGYPSGLPDDVVLPDGNDDLEPFLRSTDTTAFIVVERDVLLYERYFNGYEHDSTQTSFSVAKSFASALVGIAIDDGDIALDDPITDYLPELKDRDERFERISIRHLISMSSGLRYEEQGTPWSDDTETYYAPDLRKLALTDTEVIGPPGGLALQQLQSAVAGNDPRADDFTGRCRIHGGASLATTRSGGRRIVVARFRGRRLREDGERYQRARHRLRQTRFALPARR